MPSVRPFAASVLVLAVATFAYAADVDQWTVEKRVDSMTDKEIRTAQVTNAEGFTFKIYRVEDGKVWATFRLPEGGDVLGSELPMYRIDKHEAVQLRLVPPGTPPEVLAILGKTIDAQPRWVNFLLWHGEGKTAVAGTLREILDGTSMVFRYNLIGGGYRDTSLSLVGAKPVIAEALQIDSDPTPEAVALASARSQAVEMCTPFALARKSKDFRRCETVLHDCERLETAATFTPCIQEGFSKAKLFK